MSNAIDEVRIGEGAPGRSGLVEKRGESAAKSRMRQAAAPGC